MPSKYQTLGEFLRKPFNKVASKGKLFEYDRRYAQFITKNKIHLVGYCNIEDAYYLHCTVPSESKNKDSSYVYDVIIRFFPESEDVKKEHSLMNYKIQFFSNSPGFMYRYAVLYRKHGYLIEKLYNKMDPDFVDKMPDKTNTNYELSYDSSIYFVCKFLSAHQFRYLSKIGVITNKRKTPARFFADISSFKDVKLDSDLLAEERKAKRALTQRHVNIDDPTRTNDIRSDENPRGRVIGKKHGISKKTPSSFVGGNKKGITSVTRKKPMGKKKASKHL